MRKIDHAAFKTHGAHPTKNSSFLVSVRNAWNGILLGAKESSHVRFHFLAGVCVLLLSLICGLTALELAVVLLLVGTIISLEIINSAIENICDLLRDKAGVPYAFTGKAKDLASGAVLILAIVSLAVFALIFLPKISVLLLYFF